VLKALCAILQSLSPTRQRGFPSPAGRAQRPRNAARSSLLAAKLAAILILSWASHTDAVFAQPVRLVEKAPDPHGSPRPFRDARDVPLRTSFYFELATPADAKPGGVNPQSVSVSLRPQGENIELLRPEKQFTAGARGWLRPSGKSLFVYIEPGRPLKPLTRYTVRVAAGAVGGAGKPVQAGSWSFTTEAAPALHPLHYRLDLRAQPIQWHGRFFSGICNVVFCTRAANYGPTYALMRQAHKEHPRAWSLQRDFWLTGMEYRSPSSFFPSNLPNIVRERETRRIASMKPAAGGVVLGVEDLFGHEQYGIPAGRPVGEDYHPGDEVLIADGIRAERTTVLAADNTARTVTVGPLKTPLADWKIAYEGPLPSREDPDAPGLFPPGGCYLRKYRPCGTACYYWGRLDKEWDLAHRDGRRLMPNFADAPGDLSRDGRSWTTVKDYAQWHAVARTIAEHIIDRYGKDALGFTWSIFNEPDLLGVFWRGTWDELQTYYDYTTDAILRAFEDRGYDSDKVFIGGLELGAIFGTNFVKLREFLAHCSPRANAPGALPRNVAVADHRLDGKRSRRVEALCRAHAGKGTPCDFLSIHSYNRSEMMAAKLIRAKEIALEIDPDFYKRLWANSHEACPDWMPPPDEAAGDAYLGDGYFPTWCADVVHRQLLRAADPRFAFGETLLTVWPPPDNFATLNAVTRVLHYHENDSRTDHTVTVPMPIFHVLNLLSDMGDEYWVLPERVVGGHVIGGFAVCDAQGIIRVLLYTHHTQDTQSRSDAAFDITLDLDGVGWKGPASVREYRFDREHNSPFRLIKKIVGSPRNAVPSFTPTAYSRAEIEQVRQMCQCQSTLSSHPRAADGRLRLKVQVAGNGCGFLIIGPNPGKASGEALVPR
jgi:hypothetical protein